MHRSSLLVGLAASLLSFASAPATAQAPLTTELFVDGLVSPTYLTYAPGDPTRVFIVEQRGVIRIVENGVMLPTPFLDIDGNVSCCGERGLLSMAFHPNYQDNGRFFVNFTNNAGTTRIAELSVTANPNIANPAFVQNIALIPQDFSNHNGGCISFGPDGMLYVGMGDGGSGNDPNNRSQDGNQLLGKMLRFDVDLPAPFIPASNPFVGTAGVRDEIWHLGLRNPWRFDFDRETGDLWIADVGQNQREEVNFIPAGLGGQNLGWRCLEGTRCTGLSGCSCSDPTLLAPIIEYNHSQGCSITGGKVYRGAAIPSLQGTYFYADFCSGRIWSLRYDGMNVTDFTEREDELDPEGPLSLNSITSFGEDFDGEMYILAGSRAFKIVADGPDCGFTNYCQATANSSGSPGAIFGGGSTSIAQNDMVLAASAAPANTNGLFFYGPAQVSLPSGSGNLCVLGDATRPLIRIFPAVATDNLGNATLALDFTSPSLSTGPGAISPGDTLNFSFWFRDNVAGMNTWNFTNGLSALFCP